MINGAFCCRASGSPLSLSAYHSTLKIGIDTTSSCNPCSPTGPGSTLFVFARLPPRWVGLPCLSFLALATEYNECNDTSVVYPYLMVKTTAQPTQRDWQLNSVIPPDSPTPDSRSKFMALGGLFVKQDNINPVVEPIK
ncbi:hypothetical protein CGRA01v4_06350 [Colletotrichum graminicola]|nr:hypothetical protein CGRA01v4_06350 [Colletotrichum graminicola]